MKPIFKNVIIVVVLVAAFVTSTLLSIVVSVNLAVPVQNSNTRLDEWVKRLQSKGYSLYFSGFSPKGTAIKVETITEFENSLGEHKAVEAYWHWTQLAFPFQIVYGKIWFIDQEKTYYLETSW